MVCDVVPMVDEGRRVSPCEAGWIFMGMSRRAPQSFISWYNYHMTYPKKRHTSQNILTQMNGMRADSLTGFIAGFLVGIIGMYVYVVIIASLV